MATSIKLKFIPSKIKNKKGVICLQLIRNRKIKLLRTRFRLFPDEWDKQQETILFDNEVYGPFTLSELKNDFPICEYATETVGVCIRCQEKGNFSRGTTHNRYVVVEFGSSD